MLSSFIKFLIYLFKNLESLGKHKHIKNIKQNISIQAFILTFYNTLFPILIIKSYLNKKY